jgi:hypothetical protein
VEHNPFRIASGNADGTERLLWFNRADIKHYCESLRPFIGDLEIIKAADGEPVLIAWSPGGSGSGGSPRGSFRAAEALRKKQLRYGTTAKDVVLVIDFAVMPYHERIDLPELREWAAKEKIAFREIWITNGLWMNQRAHRIWPVETAIESP